MCCLFGLIDYRHSLTAKQKNRILSVLATACEARGIDATGIAYNSAGELKVYKRPFPAHKMRFSVPEDAYTILGHTRMTTQGSASKNRNNHPFIGSAINGKFAFAHNGVLYNDRALRHALSLPKTRIETDSYIGVQLIEKEKALDFSSLRYVAEKVEGSFTFTALDQQDNLYIVKGDNPMCLCHFPTLGIYLYASTDAILKSALSRLWFSSKKYTELRLCCGEILKIDGQGKISRDTFDDSHLCFGMWWLYSHGNTRYSVPLRKAAEDPYLEEIKSVATAFGYTPEAIDRLSAMGFSPEELEEFLYCGEI